MRPRPSASGFTLAELLVVVAILSATALTAFGLVSEDRAQVRIDDTRNRLTILRRAVLGLETPAYGGEMRLAGYVADNGRLPDNLRELVDGAATGHVAQAGVTPELASSLDGGCVQTGTGESLGIVARVLKGHRGNYLASAAHDGEFRDGWGNEKAGDDPNFGWEVTFPADATLVITSLGANNSLDADPPGAESEAEADQKMRIAGADWRVSLDGWRVTLRNVGNAFKANGSTDPDNVYDGFGTTDFNKLGVALLVFENRDGASWKWRQYRSTDTACDSVSADTLEEGESCTFTFGETVACATTGDTLPARVPLGRHVLVLTVDDGLPPPARRIVAQVDFFPGARPLNLLWTIRR